MRDHMEQLAITIALIVFIVVGHRLFWYFLVNKVKYPEVTEFRQGFLGRIVQFLVIIALAFLFILILQAVQDLPNLFSNPLN